MQVKRFVAADMRRALELVRQELGPDAIILSSSRTAAGIELLTTMGSDNELLQLQQQPLGKVAFSSATPMISDDAWSPESMMAERAGKNHFLPPAIQSTVQNIHSNSGKQGRQLAEDIEQARARMLANRKAEDSAKEFLVGKNTKVNAGIPRYTAAHKQEKQEKQELRYNPAAKEEPRFATQEDVRNIAAIAEKARSATAFNPGRAEKGESRRSATTEDIHPKGAIAEKARSATEINPPRPDLRFMGQQTLQQESASRVEQSSAKKENPMRPASSQVTIPPRRTPVPRPVISEKRPPESVAQHQAPVAKPKSAMTAAERYPLIDDEPEDTIEVVDIVQPPEVNKERVAQAPSPAARFIITAESDWSGDTCEAEVHHSIVVDSNCSELMADNTAASQATVATNKDIAAPNKDNETAELQAAHNSKFLLDIQSEIANMRSLIEQQFSRLREVDMLAPALNASPTVMAASSGISSNADLVVAGIGGAHQASEMARLNIDFSAATVTAPLLTAEPPSLAADISEFTIPLPLAVPEISEASVDVSLPVAEASLPIAEGEAKALSAATSVQMTEALLPIAEAPLLMAEASLLITEAPLFTPDVAELSAVAETPELTRDSSVLSGESSLLIVKLPESMAEVPLLTQEMPDLRGEAIEETLELPETLDIPELALDIPLLTAKVTLPYAAPRSTVSNGDSEAFNSLSAPVEKPAQSGEHLLELQSEIADMRFLLEQQIHRLTEGSAPIASSSILAAVSRRLERAGLPEDVVSKVIGECRKTNSLNEAWPEAMAILARQVPVIGRDIVEEGGVFAFVGPTGVGKTTTIGKLAARYVLKHGSDKVALITTDTYRIASHEQLRSIARILKVPVKVVDENNSLENLLKSLSHCEVILIDTAGFRHGDPQLRTQLATFSELPQIKTFLVLSTNCQAQMLKASVHAHGEARLQGCVLTKLDETSSLGEALGVVIKGWLPVAYSTDGQDIPKDIDVARGYQLVAKAIAMIKKNPISAVS